MGKAKTKPLGLDGASTPAQDDESDIVDEVGAERDEESGDLIASEEAVTKIGAVDADSVRENRRMNTAVGKKRANVPNVHFNTSNVLEKYEFIIRTWPPNTIDISMKRLTGTPVQHMITSRPRSGSELYDALMLSHGLNEEAKYEIRFIDSNEKCFRGTGQITLPDTRVQGANMPHPPPPYGYPPGYPPPGYPPGTYPPPPGYPPQAAPQAQQPQGPAQPPQPIYVQPSAGPDLGAMLGSFRELFETFQRMQQSTQPQAPVAMPPMPPMPPPGAPMDMAAMTAWIQTIADMVQRMQPQQQPARGGQPMPAPQMSRGAPPFAPPPGTIYVDGIGFVPFEALQQAMYGGNAGRQPPYRSSHRPYEEPPYARGPEYDPQRGPPGSYPGPAGPYQQRMYGGPQQQHQQPPPQTPKSIGQQVREAVGFVQEAVSAAREIENILPRQQQEPYEAPDPQDNDGPQVDQVGPARIVRNEDGTMRPWESLIANSDKIFKVASDAIREIQDAQQQHARQPQPYAQLPEGAVVVTEGFVPPPGMVAVPIDRIPPQHRHPQHRPPPQHRPQAAPPQQRQPGLDPAPPFVPPPIHQPQQSQPGPRAWETVEGEG